MRLPADIACALLLVVGGLAILVGVGSGITTSPENKLNGPVRIMPEAR